jgi:hypothetical protein
MALPRKDLRIKLDAEMHQALAIIASCDGEDISHLAEQVVCDFIRQRVHDATVLAERLTRLGTTGKNRLMTGTSGSGK